MLLLQRDRESIRESSPCSPSPPVRFLLDSFHQRGGEPPNVKLYLLSFGGLRPSTSSLLQTTHTPRTSARTSTDMRHDAQQ